MELDFFNFLLSFILVFDLKNGDTFLSSCHPFLLTSEKRPFALAIGRLFKFSSSDAALILADLTPLHLELMKSVTKRAILPLAELLPHSSRQVAG